MNDRAILDLGERVLAARPNAATLIVYRLPPRLRALVKVSAVALESYEDVQVEHIADAATIGSALDAIAASRPRPTKDALDARYGLVFFDAAGERVLSAYKGAFALDGQIDGQLCEYEETALHAWLTQRYGV
jgi:hypothetical protein